MAYSAAARRADYQPAGRPPGTREEMARAATAASSIAPQPGTGIPSPAAPPAGSDVTAFLKTATTYIPTEVVTVYVALTNAIEHRGCGSPSLVAAFLLFLLATPALVLVVYASRLHADKRPAPWPLRQWPVFEMVAATVAFVAWALALSVNPVAACPWFSTAVAGVGLVGVTAILGVAAPLFQKPLDSSK